MVTPRLALIGLGGMGRAVRQLADERGWRVVAEIDRVDSERVDLERADPQRADPERTGLERAGLEHAESGRRTGITRERLAGADVAIEFTTPEAAPGNVRACVAAGCPVVVGTTGWYAEREAVERDVLRAGGAMFWAPNFSIGANIVWSVAEYAARLVARFPRFDAHLVETHHTAKKDAPSGTALELARRAGAALGRDVPVTSVRTGWVPGTHELVFDGVYEQFRVEHVARDRRVFAEGALVAAQWLVGRRGVFTMSDLLGEEVLGV